MEDRLRVVGLLFAKGQGSVGCTAPPATSCEDPFFFCEDAGLSDALVDWPTGPLFVNTERNGTWPATR